MEFQQNLLRKVRLNVSPLLWSELAESDVCVSHMRVLAESFVSHYMICILVEQVCTVLSLHFHCSWDSPAKSEKEAFVLPYVPAYPLPGSQSRFLTPTARNFLPPLISSRAPIWLWFMCLVAPRHGVDPEPLSGKSLNNFQKKKNF